MISRKVQPVDNSTPVAMEGEASLPFRLWKSRLILGRVSIRGLRRDPVTGRWKCRILDKITAHQESCITPFSELPGSTPSSSPGSGPGITGSLIGRRKPETSCVPGLSS